MSSLNLYILILVNVLTVSHYVASIEKIILERDGGTLEGEVKVARNGRKYAVFLKIPYAKPPLGNLRFEPPQEPDPWTDTRDAIERATPCLQINGKGIKLGIEDCLYLNVFTPVDALSKGADKLPVMVYIHGGGMVYGTPTRSDPKYFMDNRIVVVNVQYRLNILGFGSNGDVDFPGNYGLKDQAFALKWVQKHIGAFGGDSNCVTLVGHSSAAANVHLHLFSPLSQGLFHRAITQSGSGLAGWAVASSAKVKLKMEEFAKKADCLPEPSSALLKCLRDKLADSLLLIHDSFKTDFASKKPFPVVIESTFTKDPFLTVNPWLHDTISTVPLISGLTSGEGGYKAIKLLQDPEMLKDLNDNYKKHFPLMLNYDWMTPEMADETSAKLKEFYFKEERIGEDPYKLVNMYTDFYFALDVLEAARRYKGLLFFYLFDHRNERTFNELLFKEYKGPDLGVCHADELISLFYSKVFTDIKEGPDYVVSVKLIRYWVNFMAKGDPNEEDKKIWLPVQSDALEYLHIKTIEDAMDKDLWIDRYYFWKNSDIYRKFEILGNKLSMQDE